MGHKSQNITIKLMALHLNRFRRALAQPGAIAHRGAPEKWPFCGTRAGRSLLGDPIQFVRT